MEFIGIKELSQHTSTFVNKKDWIVITKNGEPVKIMIDINAEDLEDLILAKHYRLEAELRQARKDSQNGKLKNLRQIIRPKKRAS